MPEKIKKSKRSNPPHENVRLNVIVTNEILGNSEKTMTLDEIKDYNRCAYICAIRAINFGGKQSMGMWTVEVA